jgi:Trk-type K+ transport system membrane component
MTFLSWREMLRGMGGVVAVTIATIATNVLGDEGRGMWASPPIRARDR